MSTRPDGRVAIVTGAGRGIGRATAMALEAYGFAEPGKASKLFCEGRTALDGEIPLNRHGGQLADGYRHGFSVITEAARQTRGDTQNQRKRRPRSALATAGMGVPTSALSSRRTARRGPIVPEVAGPRSAPRTYALSQYEIGESLFDSRGYARQRERMGRRTSCACYHMHDVDSGLSPALSSASLPNVPAR